MNRRVACQAEPNRRVSRREFLVTGLKLGALTGGAGFIVPAAWAALTFDAETPLIAAPKDPAAWPEFRRRLAAWRQQRRQQLNYADTLYRRPEFTWASRCFACCFLMLGDEIAYDARRGRYRVGEFLAHGAREFGGYDAVVLWHAYPRLGFDERNQFDFYRDLPGGLPGLRRVAGELQARGTRVFIDYNPWDRGTRRESQGDLDALVEIVRVTGADGIFLDTLDRGAGELRPKLDAARPGVVLESEIALPLDGVHDHHLSWAQWFADSAAPGVLRNKWFERRHLQHQIKRWHHDHTGELHTAWMNGSGMMIWENVFGSWVGWSVRDRSLLRAMLPIQRHFAGLFQGEGWTPLVPTAQPALYASAWEGGDLRLWTLVNRSEQTVHGPLLPVPDQPARFFDLIAGREVQPALRNGAAVLAGSIAPRGLGGFVALPAGRRLEAGFRSLLRGQQALARRARQDAAFPARTTVLEPPPPGKKHARVPDDAFELPAASFTMTVEFRSRECGFYDSCGAQAFNGEGLHQPRIFTRPVTIARAAMDLTPVTNIQFAEFLRASHYRPRHPENFLRHWSGGAPPPGQEEHPVVYVDLEDARAYARWAGKRLPTEEEWQYAAAGPGHTRFPWGDEMRTGVCNPGGGGTTPVRAFPAGRSALGGYDFCGNVWHWTESERTDGRTRFCVLKGGSWYRAAGSDWYADGGPLPCRWAAKFLLVWPGLDRCATIGFRCVTELTAG